ncbi:MAG: glycoside hydrolase family 28 protein [Acidobacteriaceae bacterium]|nr:glycoside hydrolase family 28 protein [Acidobacteriaceae bacterium]
MNAEQNSRRRFLKGASALSLVAMPGVLTAKTLSTSSAPETATPGGQRAQINVRDLGATGDGKTKDTLALQQALDRCNLLGGGEVLVPPGEYLTGALFLRSNTTLHLQEGASLLGSPDINDYPLTQVRWEGRFIKGYGAFINANSAENVTITGKGRILASPAIPGRVRNADGSEIVRPPAGTPHGPTSSNRVARRDIIRNPALMEFTRVRNLLVENIYTQGNDMWSTHPLFCENVTFRNLTIISGADGIDVDSCKHVRIDNCTFETKDDCISLKSGRGMEGNVIGVPCEDVHVSNCTFNDSGFACIGIGSEASGGVRNLLVEHCKFTGARSYAIYIKSRIGRGAFIEDLTFNDLDVSNTRQGFLRFNQTGSGLQDPAPVAGMDGVPHFARFKFTNIRVTDVPVLVQADEIDGDKPLDGLLLKNISGTCAKGMLLANIKNADLSEIHVTGFTGPLLSTYNVTGKGLANAATLEAPKPTPPTPPLQPPYVLGQ